MTTPNNKIVIAAFSMAAFLLSSSDAVLAEDNLDFRLNRELSSTENQKNSADNVTVAELSNAAASPAAGRGETTANSESTASHQSVAKKSARAIEEIIVTANRRAEDIQDVASGIQVMGGDDLEQANASSFADYLFKVPGVDIVDSGVPKQIAIRGISNLASRATQNNSSASPVGLYVNDAAIQGNGVMPDLSLYDLQRVEVLKGPQGTFYGEGAMGGMIRMVLNEAAPDEFMMKAEVGAGNTHNGSGMDRFINFAVNLPLGETWATRFVISDRVNQGYIDFVNRGTKGEDDQSSRSYRVHLDGSLFESIDVSAYTLLQKQSLEQFPQSQTEEAGELRNNKLEPQFQDIEFSLSSLMLSFDTTYANLSSTTSRFSNDSDLLLRLPLLSNVIESRVGGSPLHPLLMLLDIETPIGDLLDLGNDAIDLTPLQELGILKQEWSESRNEQKGWSQEIRAVSTPGGSFEWIAGAYYRERESALNGKSESDITEGIPAPAGPGIIVLDILETFEQKSLYGELTFPLPFDLELKTGYRWYKEDVVTNGTAFLRGPLFPFFLPDGRRDGKLQVSNSNQTFMGSLSWSFHEDMMAFVKYAEGTRSGGTNSNAIIYEMPESYNPDFLTSIELGLKTEWWDRRITANVSLYDQDWTDMQIAKTIPDAELKGTGGLVTLPAQAILNVSEAYSRGAELELGFHPLPNLSFSANLFFGEGEIVKGDPDALIPDGVRLPQLPARSYSLSMFYRPTNFTLAEMTPFLQLDTQYTSERSAFPPGDNLGLPEDSSLEEFNVWNVVAGLNGENWNISLGVKNLTDERYAVGIQQFEGETKTIARPRSYIAKIGYQF